MPDGTSRDLASPSQAGPFIAVVGPSGAGKDTILALARRCFPEAAPVRFARRVVTRAAQADAEDHDCLEPQAFLAAEAAGAFCLTWQAHGLRYGLPAGLLADCRTGHAVVANISRRALAPAAERFRALHVVEVTAPPAILSRRIAARGRETADEIGARLARSVDLEMPAGAHGHHRIDNSGAVEDAVAQFVGLVQALLARRRVDA